jgi:hypothetical protein
VDVEFNSVKRSRGSHCLRRRFSDKCDNGSHLLPNNNHTFHHPERLISSKSAGLSESVLAIHVRISHLASTDSSLRLTGRIGK